MSSIPSIPVLDLQDEVKGITRKLLNKFYISLSEDEASSAAGEGITIALKTHNPDRSSLSHWVRTKGYYLAVDALRRERTVIRLLHTSIDGYKLIKAAASIDRPVKEGDILLRDRIEDRHQLNVESSFFSDVERILSPSYADIMRLRVEDDAKWGEVAVMLGVSPSQVACIMKPIAPLLREIAVGGKIRKCDYNITGIKRDRIFVYPIIKSLNLTKSERKYASRHWLESIAYNPRTADKALKKFRLSNLDR